MKKVKILVLDDKEENRAKARELFQGKNVDLTCVDCFSTATTLLNKITYDIVLTDLMLPGEKNGINKDNPQIGQETPYGLVLAIMAKNLGIDNVAILSDINHHSGPIPWAMDKLLGEKSFLKVYTHKNWLEAAESFLTLHDASTKKGFGKALWLVAGRNPIYQNRLKEELKSDSVEVIFESDIGSLISTFVEKRPDVTILVGEINPETVETSFFVGHDLKRIMGIKNPNQKVITMGYMPSKEKNYLRLPVTDKEVKEFVR